MFAFSNMVKFFAHKLAGLSGRRFALRLVTARPFNSFLFWHKSLLN